ncbi:Sulfiredoxin, chloroplastic/mitochondrial [Linum perenne]
MANLILRVPATNLRGFSVKAASSSSSNGAAPGSVQKAGPMIVEIPLDQIKRPLMRTRTNDQDKVQDLMHSIHQIGLQVPKLQTLAEGSDLCSLNPMNLPCVSLCGLSCNPVVQTAVHF